LPLSHTHTLDSGEIFIEANSWDMKNMSNQFVTPGTFIISSSPDPHSPSIYNHVLSINVNIDSSWIPIVSALPDPIEVNYYQPTIIDLDNFVIDYDDPDSSLIWEIIDSPGLEANIDSISHELELFRAGNYAAFSTIELIVTDASLNSSVLNAGVHLLPPNDVWNLENRFILQDSLIKSISVKPPYLFSIRENQTIDLYDISIPDTLIYKSTTTIPNRMYYAKTFQNRLFIASATVNTINKIYIYDINNPLTFLNEINEGSSFCDFFVKNSICYVLKHNHILKIYDLSAIQSISLIDSFDTRYGNCKIQIKEDVMFILGKSRIMIYSLSDPVNPILISEFQCQYLSMFEGIFVINNNLYYYDIDNLYITDVSDIYNPVLVLETSQFGLIRDFLLSNNLLFIANNYDGIKIFDLSTEHFFPYMGLYKSNNTLYSHIEWISPYAYAIEIVNPGEISKGIRILKSTDPSVNIKNSKNSIVIFQFYQNYPNPFNPTTTIKYTLPKPQKVKIEVFNLLGQKITTLLDKQMSAGNHKVKFTADNLPSGVYLYRIQVGHYREVRKMIFIK
jgi:hypothetical protein